MFSRSERAHANCEIMCTNAA
uniref:Uncharacterized protein n=1 Tax=Anguilla anguilla TaxID=7936 RepID=A0A0E9TAB6_ANGAN